MKSKLVYLFLFTLLCLNIYGQSYKVGLKNFDYQRHDFQKNEIRLNLLEAAFGLPEINYERFLDDNFGIGVAGAYSLDPDFSMLGAVIPYGRLYFGYIPNSGFFIEGNAAFIIEEDYSNTYVSSGTYISNKSYSFGFGMGVAGGYKFLAKNNWVGEAYLGLGRVYGDNSVMVYPRCGFAIGKRFGK
ncbi:MAG TPA: hypothetical protein P5084_09320 [Paludibacter sp.]|nr:hypothetical protein [Paludibacter sp.]